MADVANQEHEQQHLDLAPSEAGSDNRPNEEKIRDNQLAERLSSIIEDANSRVIPLCKMIRKVGV